MDKLLFSAECDEPKIGKITRNVYNTPLTPENIQKIYDKAKKFKHLMGYEIPTYEHFITYFVTSDQLGVFRSRGILARIDDFVGIFWLTDIDLDNKRASIHYTFFDKKHTGRLNLCREAIKYVFNYYNLNEVFTLVPLYMRQPKNDNGDIKKGVSVLDFVEHIGFKKQERLKDRVEFLGHTFDANLYLLTREDVITNDIFSQLKEKENGVR